MGVYNNIRITTTDFNQRVGSLVNYLNGLDGVSAVEATEEIEDVSYIGALFSLQNTAISGFFGYKENDLENVALWLRNGTDSLVDIFASDTEDTVSDLSIHSYIDDDCIIFSIKDLDSDRNGLEVVLTNVNNNFTLVGYYEINGSSDFVDISLLTFENIDDMARIPYTYTNMFPYAADIGTLDFLGQSYFINNGIRKFTSKVLKECSTVTLLSTASLPSPLNNHLAIGAHCIVPLDEEGGNE